MKAIKRQHQVFIDEMIKHGDPTQAYMTAYPNAKVTSARVKSYNLLQNVTIQSAIKEKAEKVAAIATQEAITELKDRIVHDILTREEKLSILNKIAKGEIEISVKKPVWDKNQEKFVLLPVLEPPDYAARMKAVDLDNKMQGHYAPIKGELSGPDGAPIQSNVNFSNVDYTKLDDEILQRIAEARIANKD